MKSKLYIAFVLTLVMSGCLQSANDTPTPRPSLYETGQDKSKKEVPFETKQDDGSPIITIFINGEAMGGAIWDTGATTTQISHLEFVKMIKSGKVDQDKDLIRYETIIIADGSIVDGVPVYNMKEIALHCKDGRILTCYNVEVCVVENIAADILLGQNVMQKLPKCSVNTVKQVIEFE